MITRSAAGLVTALATALLVAGAAVPNALAHEYEVGTLTIVHPWARASAGAGKTGAVYVTIQNRGDAPERLLGASTAKAETAELHTHVTENDVMKMRAVDAIEVAPGDTFKLAPGGVHVMLMGLASPLVEYGSFPMTLHFEHAGDVEIEVIVESVAAMQSGDHDDAGGHDMDHEMDQTETE